MRSRIRYLPIELAREGMVLVDAARDNYERVLLPVGAVLTDENLHQLVAHHVQFVCVSQAETRTPEQIAVDAAESARKVLKVFQRADLSDPLMASLFNQTLMYRSA
jgi:hypothetical protein